MVILDYRESKRGSATNILDGICTSETGIISNGRTDTRIDSVGVVYLWGFYDIKFKLTQCKSKPGLIPQYT